MIGDGEAAAGTFRLGATAAMTADDPPPRTAPADFIDDR
jgi:hypothetical protein